MSTEIYDWSFRGSQVVRGWQLVVAYTNKVRVLLQQYMISVIFSPVCLLGYRSELSSYVNVMIPRRMVLSVHGEELLEAARSVLRHDNHVFRSDGNVEERVCIDDVSVISTASR